jgi:uncharacterized membrane protein YedE/YeeE
MTLAWDLFTPWSALAGGLLIGLAAALYILGNGRIAGIASLLAGPLNGLVAERSLASHGLRLSFLAGLLAARRRGLGGGGGGEPWQRLHQRAWCVRAEPAVTALLRERAVLHGRRLRDGIPIAPPSLNL